MMLKENEIIKAADNIDSISISNINVSAYSQDDFKDSSSEEFIHVVRVADVSIQPEKFWVYALLETGIKKENLKDFIEGTEFLYENLDPDQALLIINEKLEGLKVNSKELLPDGKITSSARIADDWYYVSIFILTEKEQYAFFWETSA